MLNLPVLIYTTMTWSETGKANSATDVMLEAEIVDLWDIEWLCVVQRIWQSKISTEK